MLDALLRGKSPGDFCPNPYGGGVYREKLEQALEIACDLIGTLASAGISAAVGIDRGRFQRTANISAWNVSAVALNTAARLAFAEEAVGRVFVTPRVRQNAGHRVAFSDEEVCHVKGKPYHYHAVDSPAYQQGELQAAQNAFPQTSPRVPPHDRKVVLWDIVKYSTKEPDQQAALAQKLAEIAETALHTFNADRRRYSPTGDGGFAVFAKGLPAMEFARHLISHAISCGITIRTGISDGQVVVARRGPVGPCVIAADRISAQAPENGIAIPEVIWANDLNETAKRGWKANRLGDDLLELTHTENDHAALQTTSPRASRTVGPNASDIALPHKLPLPRASRDRPRKSESSTRIRQGTSGSTPSARMTRKSEGRELIFLSHASADSDSARELVSKIEAQGIPCWIAPRDIAPGANFSKAIVEAIEMAEIFVVLLSESANQSEYVANEIKSAASYRKRIVPLRIENVIPSREIELQISGVHSVDLFEGTQESGQGFQRLIDELRDILAERTPDITKAPPNENSTSLAPLTSAPGPKLGKLSRVNPLLIGRDQELHRLDEAWKDPTIGVVAIVALGGVGKTSLAVNWYLQTLVHHSVRVFVWSFYSQGSEEDRQASAESFLDHALKVWFGKADPPKDSWARGELLAQQIRSEPTLLILDGLEPTQYPPGQQFGRFKDRGMVALIKELALRNSGMCLCTSRFPLTDLRDYSDVGLLKIDLGHLSPKSGGEYLRQLGVNGTEPELQAASSEFGDHPLALTLLGSYLVKDRGGDARRRDTIPRIFEPGGRDVHARRVLKEYERLFRDKPELTILRTLGLFNREADRYALKVLRRSNSLLRKLSPDAWSGALATLAQARLIEYLGTDPDGNLDCHPLIREYFLEEYKNSERDAFREDHSKLFEHYSRAALDFPDTLEEMEPLFHSVYHACQAKRYREALKLCTDRILRGDELYLVNKLGAYGIGLSLVANFFSVPWSQLVDEFPKVESARLMKAAGFALRTLGLPTHILPMGQSAWMMGAASFALRAMGRIAEATAPMQSAADGAIAIGDWKLAAERFSLLVEIQLVLGQISAAIATGQRSVELADRSKDELLRRSSRMALADAMHQSGDLRGSAQFFSDPEKMPEELKSQNPVLYALQLNAYSDLLLDLQKTDGLVHRTRIALERDRSAGLLLAAAVDRLMLGRVLPLGSTEAGHNLEEAVTELRRAGFIEFLPGGLLARAAHLRVTGDFDKAQKDLDEARILATRCSMLLSIVDYHLEQARLFFSRSLGHLAAPHCLAAKELINSTGYRRRDAELETLTSKLH
jgi:hypothetical protein